MKRWQAISIFTIGAGAFGFTPIFVKLNFAAGHTLAELIVMQMVIAAAVLWLIPLFKKKTTKLSKKNILHLMLAGTFTGLTGIFYYASMQYIPASIAIVILFQFVWIGIVYEWLFDKRKPSVTTYISVVLTLTGVIFAADVMSGDFSTLPFIGVILALLGAFFYAGFIYVSGRVATNVSPFLRAPLMMTGSLIMALIVFPPTFLFTEKISSSIWLYGGGAALFGGILPPLLFAIGAPHLPAGVATILGSIELPVAVIMASLILSETVTPLQWIGIILIVMAISFDEVKLLLLRVKNRAYHKE